MGRHLYFDNNATTPVDSRVLDAMMPYLTSNFHNPHSPHHLGASASEAVETARMQVGDLIGANKDEIIFTSGSTESINIAIKGIIGHDLGKRKHIITVATEHHAVIDTCKFLENCGYEVTYLPVDRSGLVDLDLMRAAIRDDTLLTCVMYVNNETGLIQPIKEIASIVHDLGSIFLCDATQAVGKLKVDVKSAGIDILCISAHKIYGPKGVGALYIKDNIALSTYTHGGGQEKGVRSGTLNVPGIVALGVACELAQQEMDKDSVDIGILRDNLENALLKFPGTFINGATEHRIYNVTNICFPGFDASVLMGRMKNVAVSNGSACASAVTQPSHVLKALGLSDEDAFSSIRFSLGRFNTNEDVDSLLEILSELLKTNLVYA